MQMNRILSNLGLAQRAGAVVSGEFAVEKAVKCGMAELVIVACDASDNTKKKMRNMTDYYQVPMLMYATREELGHSLGKEYRSMAAVTDPGFAASIEKKFRNEMTTE